LYLCQYQGTIHKEVENTQKKLEKVREDIKKEEKQTQGLSAESDKTNKETLKATLDHQFIEFICQLLIQGVYFFYICSFCFPLYNYFLHCFF
jgi:septal ring factor EnvC (AmiA/AmiB activator)